MDLFKTCFEIWIILCAFFVYGKYIFIIYEDKNKLNQDPENKSLSSNYGFSLMQMIFVVIPVVGRLLRFW